MAHRGIFYYYKENSLDSILEIFNYKSNKFKLGVEFDINLTKDDNLIIYHDKTINNENINNLTYEQIKKYDNSIPKLEEVLVAKARLQFASQAIQTERQMRRQGNFG